MTNTQTIILLVEVGIIATCYLIATFRK